MPKSREYQRFLNLVGGRVLDDLPQDEETVASLQEIGWWKQHQVKRALRRYRRGDATLVDYSLVQGKTGVVFSRATRKRIKELRG